MTLGWRLLVVLTVTPALAGDAGSPDKAVNIQGSWAGIGIVRSLIREFGNTHGAGAIGFGPRDSGQVLAALSKHECDVGLVLDSLASPTAEASSDKYARFPLGRFVVFVIVNAKSPVRKMTLDELGKVFQGRITSWQEISNSNSASRIEVYCPLVTQTESYIFRRTVMQGAPFGRQLLSRSTRPRRQKLTSDEVVGAVAKQRNAVGFFLLGYDNKLDKRVRALGIAKDEQSKPIRPSASTIADGTYLLTDTMTFRLRPDAPPVAKEFCAFATGPEGAKIVKQFRLFPDYEWQKYMGKLRLADMKAGKGTPIAASGFPEGAKLMRDLVTEFVKTTAVVQMRYERASQVGSVQDFIERGELLLSDGPLPRKVVEAFGEQWSSLKPRRVGLGRMVAAVVVHPVNPLDAITFAQLRAIYAGKIRKWSAVEVEDETGARSPVARKPGHKTPRRSEPRGARDQIHRYSLSGPGPILRLFHTKDLASQGRAEVITRSDTAKLIDAVAKDPAAIGFVDLSKLSPNDASVKLMRIIPPGKARAAPTGDPNCDGYPLARHFMLYVSSRTSKTTLELVEFLTSDRCVEVLGRHSLVPPAPPGEDGGRPVEVTRSPEQGSKGK